MKPATKEHSANLWPIVKAHAEGETIEYWRKISQEWTTCENPTWRPDVKYRVKPKAKKIYVVCSRCPKLGVKTYGHYVSKESALTLINNWNREHTDDPFFIESYTQDL